MASQLSYPVKDAIKIYKEAIAQILLHEKSQIAGFMPPDSYSNSCLSKPGGPKGLMEWLPVANGYQ